MKKNIIKYTFLLTAIASLNACTKMKDTGFLNEGDFPSTGANLKDASDIKLGVGIDYTPMLAGSTYASLVKANFDAVTYGYNMKHGALVQGNGTIDFSRADALANAVGSMEIFGHTLGWHANQNAGYLKNYAGITVAAPSELLPNGGFESGQGAWSTYNTNGATVSYLTNGANARTGSGFMSVVNPNNNAGGEWRVQVGSQELDTKIGTPYMVTYYIRATQPGGNIRLSTQGGTAQYQGGQAIGMTWQQVSWTFTASAVKTRVLFDMGLVANTYYIDDVSVKESVVAPSGAEVASKVDAALKNFITETVTHYKGKVKEWDVINETMSPSGAYRTSANSSDVSNKEASDIFFWGDYLGRDFGLKAFNYAAAADPSATLYINDYGLESSRAKTDSLIAYVKELKAKGAKIDGIGTQMHVNWNANYALIDSMFIKLAATGLKVRISELDVRINPLGKVGFVMTPLQETYQAAMYEYIIKAYLKYVPSAQRAGITVWGISDDLSWLYDGGKDFPLLFNSDFSKKKAFDAVYNALKDAGK
ncbi:endo-1,4-beta-xylanase [Polluticaenibacter yanchengensis]|uniref:Beta-xylanase n=1 Tax=Polluticaenibacter yanchengensis TaxID=3014562 RepID=A0ABT4UKN1_9BACT|nr:endo-1,4-beta-xylanase [Chitinophagaceae bacterium LY-5]